jgi:Right handed beta helix region
LRLRHGGRLGARIVLRSYPGERATLVGIVEIQRGVNDVTLSRLNIEGTGDENTVKILSARDVVEKSNITNYRRGASCMILGDNSGWGQAMQPIIRHNRIHDCGSNALDYNHQHGIYGANVVAGRIVYNVIWNVAAKAVQLYPNAQQTRFAYNIIDGGGPSVRGGVIFGGDDTHASNDNVVEHNIIAYARSYNIDASWEATVGSGNIVRKNCLWAGREGNIDLEAGGFSASGNIVANPLFVNRNQHDYRLRRRSSCWQVFFDAGTTRSRRR